MCSSLFPSSPIAPLQNMFIVSPGGGGHHRRRPGDAAKSRLHPHVPVEVRTASLQRCGSRATSCATRVSILHSPPSPWTGTGRSTIHQLRQREDSEERRWNDWPEDFTEETLCMLTEERGYVIYSASGSFSHTTDHHDGGLHQDLQSCQKDRLRHKAKAAASWAAMRKEISTPHQPFH
ncbi:hypothetical protein CEXT_215091 [Caerostris extrusa]|uniref:Uncharacterized protein n=1 Tax=Caerostris extrusa TaxID=172846 RepID=A0AAV4W8W6_CAEEX|nr:hypothetical protein CEXT_215091 [Caerostris extrusa]